MSRVIFESTEFTRTSGSTRPSIAIGAVPSVASFAPSRFNNSKTSTTKRSVVPLGASFARNTSSRYQPSRAGIGLAARNPTSLPFVTAGISKTRSEEHTSELQSQFHLVCRLLLEKKNRQLAY